MPILAADPLYIDGLDFGVIVAMLIKVVVVFVFLLIATMFMVWYERKVVSDLQNRVGPNRAGPYGILQTFADGIKLFFKEDLKPERADKRIFRLAPYLSLVPAFLTFSIVPIAGIFNDGRDGTFTIFGHKTYWQLADPPVGILLALACSSIAVYGVMLAGWSSGSKYPLLGAVRASAQMISYEAALGLSVVTVVLASGTLSTHGMVVAQSRNLAHWNIFEVFLVPFFIFIIAATAELNRPPFDLVEAEQELVGGFNTEYSSIRFALFFLAEFMNVVTMSAIIVTLFLGGPIGPIFGPSWFQPILPFVYFFGKVGFFLFLFVWFRATLPRLRYDQLMDLGWKLLIPAALAWMLLVAAFKIASDHNWNPLVVAIVAVAGIAAGASMLVMAMRTSAARRELGEVDA